MKKKTNYSYIGIAFIILLFGIIFVPKIVNRVKNNDISRSDRLSAGQDNNFSSDDALSFIEINGKRKKVPNFSFTNQDGETISQEDYKGKVYVVEFFFTTCPTICPRMNKNLVEIQDVFKGTTDFGIASFSITPKTDTPAILKEYAEEYGVTNPNWNLMTGNEADIYELANKGFNIYVAKVEDEVGFEHSGDFALIDKNGFVRSRLDAFGNPKIFYKGIISEKEKYDEDGNEQEISMLKEDIKKLLNE
ncbi:SCO family protein [Bizionia gelidisalsuginis]|uniref:SCO family protein n=2 Tax=Bizionia TaxID=283785 RepID=A0A8H2LFN9_9FLAO|nr:MULTISPECIES: SCO family protein [Bizionia]TYB72199.1 SCO family protein [Bizionia saleffrena]TYC10697.1 SCO family protein [Bizionia gelidisalsuginis]